MRFSHLNRAGPSWSGINHDGSWKLLHYAAARFFAPLAVSAQLDSAKGVAHVHITSDVPAPVAGASPCLNSVSP